MPKQRRRHRSMVSHTPLQLQTNHNNENVVNHKNNNKSNKNMLTKKQQEAHGNDGATTNNDQNNANTKIHTDNTNTTTIHQHQMTNAMRNAFDAMAEALACPLCHQVMRQPQTLQCHSFCAACIDAYSRHSKNDTCPVPGCHQPLSLRGGRKGKFRAVNPSLETLTASWQTMKEALRAAPEYWWRENRNTNENDDDDSQQHSTASTASTGATEKHVNRQQDNEDEEEEEEMIDLQATAAEKKNESDTESDNDDDNNLDDDDEQSVSLLD